MKKKLPANEAEVLEYYHSRILEAKEKKSFYSRRALIWSGFRLFLVSIVLFYFIQRGWASGLEPYGVLTLGIIAFLWGVVQSTKVNQKLSYQKWLILFHQQEIETLGGHFQFRNTGKDWYIKFHPYADDLDILGDSSLFQKITRSNSERGSEKLAQWLLHPAGVEEIKLRQEAVQELAGQMKWCQRFLYETAQSPFTKQTEENWKKFIALCSASSAPFTHPAWRWFAVVWPSAYLAMLTGYLLDWVSGSVFYAAIAIGLIVTSILSKKVMPYYLLMNKRSAEIEGLGLTINCIERASFQTEKNRSIQADFEAIAGEKASGRIRSFRKILDRMDLRLNPLVFIPLNIFLAWDLQQMLQLQKWHQKTNHRLFAWLEGIAQWEALISIAIGHFNHPENCFPQFSDQKGTFSITGAVHPLIPRDKAVPNSFHQMGLPGIALITGSNMAGKSTFLRTIGVNTILAMAGSPVAARQMKLYPIQVRSSMRISDNLEESTSTFYAELKKLESIIQAVKKREPALLLLDEILRGTNSADRQKGSAAFLKLLVQENALALMATHDLQLAALQGEYPAHLHNFHFDVQVQGEELYFDYKIKTGVCQSMNASLLMKKIGIDCE